MQSEELAPLENPDGAKGIYVHAVSMIPVNSENSEAAFDCSDGIHIIMQSSSFTTFDEIILLNLMFE